MKLKAQKFLSFFLLFFTNVLFTAGCGIEPVQQQQNESTRYSVTDSTGYVVTLPQKPRKIISLTLGTDEMLVGMASLDHIAALTYLSDDPGVSNVVEQAKQVPEKIKDANTEIILSLKPDLVITADWVRPEVIQTMRDLQIPLYVYHTPDSIEGIQKAIADIGQAINEQEKAKQLIAVMNEELAKVKKQAAAIPKDKKQTLAWTSLMGSYGGKDSLFDDMCQLADVINGAAAVGLGKNDVLTKEGLVKANPDFLLVPTWNYDGKWDVEKFKADLQNDPALQSIPAIQNHRLEQIPDRYLFCSSQYIVYGVRDIFQTAYVNKSIQ